MLTIQSVKQMARSKLKIQIQAPVKSICLSLNINIATYMDLLITFDPGNLQNGIYKGEISGEFDK